MEEDQIYGEVFEEITAEGNPQSVQQGQQSSPSQPTQQTQQPQQTQQAQSSNTAQGQQAGGSNQPQAAGIETNDNMIEEAEKQGQPSNTITEWQRVHDKGYVERITEKTEKH